MLLLFKLTNTTLCKSTSKFPIKLDTVESEWSIVCFEESQSNICKQILYFFL